MNEDGLEKDPPSKTGLMPIASSRAVLGIERNCVPIPKTKEFRIKIVIRCKVIFMVFIFNEPVISTQPVKIE
jgi:hypothetical protein